MPEEHPAHKGASPFSITDTAQGRTASRPYQLRRAFNPGLRPGSRFAFFGTPPIPVLYGAETEEAAICETLLHDVPNAGGVLHHRDYADKVAARLILRRDLRLASFLGTGLRAFGVGASALTDTPASTYRQTVAWAQAAHAAGFDGAAWMSRRCNSDRAYVLFGDRVVPGDLEQDPGFGRIFGTGLDLDRLIDWCATVRVDVMPPI
ncbi:RES family NAD+ phosphorylase [Corynebacteriales bacterium D3-21]|uniref:RES family NAD+ phosphorylase n=2 Tax=Speluncibacter jeojiensis TaxID=2710754 RepID=A0A9X4M7A1_9ACTN|nr:RES family NAD+ phosphorylase [Corynebacteriales bacterium D3-21]